MKRARETECGEIRYDDISIPYSLVRSDRRSYAIQVKQNGEVVVRTPRKLSRKFLDQLLDEKRDWIREKYGEQRENSARLLREKTDPELVNLTKQYRQAAKEYIGARVRYYQTMTGARCAGITIRDQKTRWGSCSARGTLSFSWRLMLAPPDVLDYVVVHELCHLNHMNHSQEFWKAVESVMPDYKGRRQWLRDNGSSLHL